MQNELEGYKEFTKKNKIQAYPIYLVEFLQAESDLIRYPEALEVFYE